MVLLAGGPADVANDFRRRLAPYGVEVAEHREWQRPRQLGRPIPADIDVVLALTDMLGHADFDMIRRTAGDVPVVLIHRKWSETYQRLYKAGLLRHWNGAPGPARGRRRAVAEPDLVPLLSTPMSEAPAPVEADPRQEPEPLAPASAPLAAAPDSTRFHAVDEAAWRILVAAELARIQANLPAGVEVLAVLSPTNMQVEFTKN